jgi:hypothetical protein
MKFFNEADSPVPTGAVDRFVRRHRSTSHVLATALLYLVAASALGLALVPTLLLAEAAAPLLWEWDHWARWPALGLLAGAGTFLWGFSLLVVVPLFNFVLPTRVRPFTGGYFSVASVPWYLHNGLFYLVRFTFLPFVTMTPVGTLFLKAMGMRAGKRPRIATENFSDVRLITLGDDVAIGGSATIFCHFGGAGRLVIAPVVIESRATIGEKATLMGDVHVGEGATVLAHSVLLPGARVGAGETWGGVPARPIAHEEWTAYKAMIRGRAPLHLVET